MKRFVNTAPRRRTNRGPAMPPSVVSHDTQLWQTIRGKYRDVTKVEHATYKGAYAYGLAHRSDNTTAWFYVDFTGHYVSIHFQ